MKNRRLLVPTIAVLILGLSAGVSFAQVQNLTATLSAPAPTGGLGTGLSRMVKSILGDTDATSDASIAMPPMTVRAEDLSTTSVQKENNAPKAAAIRPATSTDTDVDAAIAELLRRNDYIQSIEASDTHVRIVYRIRARALGFIRIELPVTAAAYVSGATTITYPWYGFFTVAPSDFSDRFEARVAPLITPDIFTPETRIALIREMQRFLSEEFNTPAK